MNRNYKFSFPVHDFINQKVNSLRILSQFFFANLTDTILVPEGLKKVYLQLLNVWEDEKFKTDMGNLNSQLISKVLVSYFE